MKESHVGEVISDETVLNDPFISFPPDIDLSYIQPETDDYGGKNS